MQRPLAVSGEDDRAPGIDGGKELVEGAGDIAIGKVERLIGILAVEQEGAIGLLPVSARPDLRDLVEGARLAADEEARAVLAVAVVERRVPAVALEIGGR